MKKILNTLSMIAYLLGSSLSAQTKATNGIPPNQSKIDPLDPKANFIKNQNYLSPTSLKDYRNYYGDSLKGFDESTVKAELLSRHYYGQEFIAVMALRKRDFIENKYKIGAYASKPVLPSLQPQGNPKPIGGINTTNVAPCVNEDFESTTPGAYNNISNAATGWTVESTTSQLKQMGCGTPTNPGWVGGSPEFSIMSTPIFGVPFIGTIPNSPLGGTVIAQLNDATPGFVVTRLSTTFPVTSANTLFQFAYAGSWNGTGHQCCDQPFFTINMYDCTGAPLGCSSISLTPPGAMCQNGVTGYSVTNGISWTNWQIKYIDLTPFVGTCVTIRVVNGDCNGGAHHGSLYFDARCGGSLLCPTCTPPQTSTTNIGGPVSFCAGSGLAQIVAPTGYATYSWVAPPSAPAIPANQATQSTIFIPSPQAGAVYTVYLTTPSGCLFVSTNTILPSTVNISGVSSAPSCAGGASGSATVTGNGSAAGYNYTWLSTTNSVVGTSSVATGLLPGTYSIILTGLGAAGCGSAVTTVTVGSLPPGVINLLKPFCGNVAYLVTNGGSNFQWYNGTSAITASLGGNSSSLTINNPQTGSVVTLTYLSPFGCQDSVRYTLAAINPGFISATPAPWICPGANNGTATLNLAPVLGGPTGLNTFNISSIGTTPAYNVSSGPSNATTVPLTGLAGGSYSVNSFDGSCYYSATFNINTYTFNFVVTPSSPTLCAGSSVQAAITLSNASNYNDYTYSWSPSTWLIGISAPNSIISPTIAPGAPITNTYAIVVTPTVVNCPVTKILTVTAVNPPIPTITAIPDLCNTSLPYQIITSPQGGTFSTGFTGANSPVSQSGGLITPSHTNVVYGTNNFVYAISIYTCVATKSGTYHVSQFHSAVLTSSVPPLCVTSPAFNLMNIVQTTLNGSWSGPGVSPTNQFIPANLNTNTYQISYGIPSSPNPTVCPSTTNISVAVTKTTIPTIPQVPEFCTNNAPFTLAASPAGGGWLPVTGLNNSGIVTPANITVPNITATYTVNDGPCLNTGTTILLISQHIPATLSGSVNNLCYNSNPVNLMSIVQNTTGSWSGVAGVLSNTFFASGLATNTYVASYHVNSTPNPTLCADTKTIVISVLNPDSPTITAVAPLCNNSNPFQLVVTPGGGNWTASPYLSANGIFTPSLSSVGNNAVQYIIGTNICNRQETKFVSVEAFVPATITGNIPDLCNTSLPINLSPFTLNNSGTWNGNGISGSIFNPGNTGSGTFNLTYHTSSSPSGLCPDEASISVSVFSLAIPAVTQAGPFCNSSLPVQLQVSPVGGLFGGSNVGAVSLGGMFNPALAIVGDNLITYSITSGPCKAQAQTLIKVEKFVPADFAKKPGPYCKTDEPVNMMSFVQNPGGDFFGDGMAGPFMFSPAIAKTLAVNTVTYFTNSITKGLCPDSKTVAIEVRNNPVVTALTNTTAGCAPLEVSFHTESVNSGMGIWSINDGSEPVHGLSGTHIFTATGVFNIQFNYTDGIGCKAQPVKTNEITVKGAPKADFSFPDEIYISEPKIQLTNLSSPLENNNYEWYIPNLLQSNDLVPFVVFPKIGKYQVRLTASSPFGCKDEITKTIEVKNNFNIFVPNSFSPNNDDLNDTFLPVFTKEGMDTKYFEMEIFDRWGHSVFRTKDINKGWDGTMQNKGETLKEDTYIYKIKYKDAEGNLFEKIGNVLLIR